MFVSYVVVRTLQPGNPTQPRPTCRACNASLRSFKLTFVPHENALEAALSDFTTGLMDETTPKKKKYASKFQSTWCKVDTHTHTPLWWRCDTLIELCIWTEFFQHCFCYYCQRYMPPSGLWTLLMKVFLAMMAQSLTDSLTMFALALKVKHTFCDVNCCAFCCELLI